MSAGAGVEGRIGCQRQLFDIPDDVTYLNCAYMGPQLREVTDAGRIGSARKASPWKLVPEDFFAESERLRSLFAELIDATADDVALIPAASYGSAVAAANIQLTSSQEILLLAEQFPSNVYQWRDLASRTGARIATVDRPDDNDWTSAVLDRIHQSTGLAALPTCHWTDGSKLDLRIIGGRCREVGARLFVDGTQSVGAAPFSVKEIRPDFLVASAYKWLLGPYSIGYLYVDPRFHDGTPVEHNWITRAGSSDFAGLTSYRDDFDDGARRYDVGERSNFTLVPMAIAALEQIGRWGVQRIARTLSDLSACVESMAREGGHAAIPADKRVAHLIGVYLSGALPDDLIPNLAARGIFVSRRGRSLRIAPHLYNTRDDVSKLFHELSDVLRTS